MAVVRQQTAKVAVAVAVAGLVVAVAGALLQAVTVLAVVAAYFFFFNPGIRVQPGTDGLTVSAPKSESVTVAYADVTSLTLVSQPDYGVGKPGGHTGDCLYGQWENDAWGSYQLYVNKKVLLCVVIRTDKTVAAVNESSEQETRALWDMLRQSCPNAVTAEASCCQSPGAPSGLKTPA